MLLGSRQEFVLINQMDSSESTTVTNGGGRTKSWQLCSLLPMEPEAGGGSGQSSGLSQPQGPPEAISSEALSVHVRKLRLGHCWEQHLVLQGPALGVGQN